MKRVGARAHLPTPWLFEPAKCPDDRAEHYLGLFLYAFLIQAPRLFVITGWSSLDPCITRPFTIQSTMIIYIEIQQGNRTRVGERSVQRKFLSEGIFAPQNFILE